MQLRGKTRTLARYLAGYVLAITVMVAALIPIYFTALGSIRKNSVEILTQNISDSVVRLEKSIEATISLNGLMISVPFSRLKSIKDEDFTNPNLYNLIQVQSLFSKITKNINFISAFYMVFDKNSKIITASNEFSSTTYMDQSVFFDKYMVYEELDEDIYKRLTGQTEMVDFIHSTPLRINQNPATECMTLVTRITGSMVSICAVYSVSELYSLFGMDNLPPNSYFTLQDSDGADLISYNHQFRGEPAYTLLSFDVPIIEGRLCIGVPESFFSSQISSTKMLLDWILISAVLLGLVLAVVLAYYNYLPINKLVKLIEKNTLIKSSSGDVEYIRWVSDQFMKTNNRLQGTLDVMKNSMCENALRNLLLGTDMNDAASAFLRELEEKCRICLIDIGCDKNDSDADKIGKVVYRMLSEESFHTVFITRSQIAALFEEKRVEQFMNTKKRIASTVELDYSSRLSAILSYCFTGKDAIREVYLQTQLASIYSSCPLTFAPEPGKRNIVMSDYVDLRKLTITMRMGTEDDIRRFFKDSLSTLISDGGLFNDVKELYSILSAAPSIYLAEKGSSIISHSVPIFDDNASVFDQFNTLCNICISVMQRKYLKSANETYKEKLIKYIDANFSNPELYAGMLAEHFAISTKQVYLVVRELTGVGYSDYVDNLRMAHAMKLLSDVGKPISEIAQDCGYHSLNTFYKAFKKAYGYAPSALRKNDSKGAEMPN